MPYLLLNQFFGELLGFSLPSLRKRAAASIEYVLGIEMGSENTEQIVGLNQNRSTHHHCYIHYRTDS